MTLPLLRGYPITFSVSLDTINQQYNQLSESGQLPTHWTTTGDSWKLDAKLEAAYIDIDPNFPQSIRLNFPVQTGTFTAVVGDGASYKWVPYQLDGVVFSFLTPTRLMHSDDPTNTALTVQSLFLELDSPHMDTVVETSKAINTQMPNHIRVSLAERIRAYIKELAQQHPNNFIISTSLTAKNSQQQTGCLDPNGADYSTYPQNPASVNWLFTLPFTSTPSSSSIGHFDNAPLLPNTDGTMQIAGYALIHCLVLPAINDAMGIPASQFNQSQENSTSAWLKNNQSVHGWTMTKADIFRSGDHIQCNFAMTITKTVSEGKWIFKITESVTVNVSWETHISFSLADGYKVTVQAVNKNEQVTKHSSGSVFGIPIPSFLNDLAMDLASAITNAVFQGPSLQSGISNMISQVHVLGGGSFTLNTVQTIDGNLVLGLKQAPYSKLPCSAAGSLRSLNSNKNTDVTFFNRTGDTITLHWIDYQGNMPSTWSSNQHPYVIQNGNSLLVSSFVTHPFAVYNSQNQCIGIYRLDAQGANNKMNIYIH